VDRMSEHGFREGESVRFDFQNAHGDIPIAAMIARKFVADRCDLIFVISTPSTQAAVNVTRTIPIVFGAVTDPLSAKVISHPRDPLSNVTGISDRFPVADQLDLIMKLQPSVKKIGWLYNPSEANSAAAKKMIEEVCSGRRLTLIVRPVNNSTEIRLAAQSIIEEVDCFYAAGDNTVASGIGALLTTAYSAKKPVYASDTGMVEGGAIATIGISYREIGQSAADMAKRILDGAKPSDIPIRYAEGHLLWINLSAAEKVGLEVPEDLLSAADRVLK